MTKEHRQERKARLALALAQGRSVAAWAHENHVRRSTAYRWAGQPEVRAAAESRRRRACNRVLGRLARRAYCESYQVAKLAECAESEPVSGCLELPSDLGAVHVMPETISSRAHRRHRCQRAFTWHLWHLWHVRSCQTPRVLIGPPRRGLIGFVLRDFSSAADFAACVGDVGDNARNQTRCNRQIAPRTRIDSCRRPNMALDSKSGARATARWRPDERTQLDGDSTFRPGALGFEHEDMALLSLRKSAISRQFLPSILTISAAFCR
jgi:hypothetical protein